MSGRWLSPRCYIVFTICPYKAAPVYKMLSKNFGFGGFRRGSRGVVGVGGLNPPPPGIFKIYISENNISRFSALTGVFFVCAFQNFPVRFACYYYLVRMKVYLCHVTILRQFYLLSWNLKVTFASSYTICICAHIPVHSHLVVKVPKYRCMYNVYKISKTVIFLHFFKI